MWFEAPESKNHEVGVTEISGEVDGWNAGKANDDQQYFVYKEQQSILSLGYDRFHNLSSLSLFFFLLFFSFLNTNIRICWSFTWYQSHLSVVLQSTEKDRQILSLFFNPCIIAKKWSLSNIKQRNWSYFLLFARSTKQQIRFSTTLSTVDNHPTIRSQSGPHLEITVSTEITTKLVDHYSWEY